MMNQDKTDVKTVMKEAGRWFDAVSVGALITSAVFYGVYDQWKPLVWAAGCVASVKVFQHFIRYMDGAS